MEVLVFSERIGYPDCAKRELLHQSAYIDIYPLKRIEEALIKKRDLIILDVPDQKLKAGELEFIIKIHCKSKAPILAIVDSCCENDYWMLEEMGITEYINRPLKEEEFNKKLACLLKK